MIFWRPSVAARTAQPEQLLQGMTGTERLLGGAISQHAPTTWIPTVVRVNIYLLLNPARAGGEGWALCWSWRAEGKEGSDFLYQIREVAGRWEEGSCGGVCGGGGKRVRGKGRIKILLRQQISTVAWSQCQVTEWAGRRWTVNTESKKSTSTNIQVVFQKHTQIHMHYTHAHTPYLHARAPSHPGPSGGKALFSSPLLASRTTSCQLRRIARGRNALAQTAREGAVITRPAEMPSDPQTQAVWPAVDWEWLLLTLPCSLLTTCPSESWNIIKTVILHPKHTHTQTHTC